LQWRSRRGNHQSHRRNTIRIRNHLISPEDLFEPNPKQPKKTGKNLCEIKGMGLLPFLSLADAHERNKEKGPRRGSGSGGSKELWRGCGSRLRDL
jgi:hypothetical protein